MGEARRKRALGIVPAPAAPKPVRAVSELVHLPSDLSAAISEGLAFVNAERQVQGKKPMPRSVFIGYLLVKAGLADLDRARAAHEAGERLVVTPDEYRAAASR